MNWFDEQIQLRKQSDDERFRESLRDAADVVLGRPGRENAGSSDDAQDIQLPMEQILRYLHVPMRKLPASLTGVEARLEYLLRPYGIMYRPVEMKKGWHLDACGAYLLFRESDGKAQAVVPGTFWGYCCYDPVNHKKIPVTGKNEAEIGRNGYLFYSPFPQERLTIAKLMAYIMKSCLRMQDYLMVFFITLMVTWAGFFMPRLTRLLFGPVLQGGDVGILGALAVFMLCAQLSVLLFNAAKDLITGCIQTRMSLAVESAAMARVLALPASFFPKYSTGELSSRLQSVNNLCSTVVNMIFSAGLTSLLSLAYVVQIFRFAPSLVIPGLIILAARIILSVLTILVETRRQKRLMEENAKSVGLAFSLVNAVQKIRLSGAEKRSFAKWAEQYNKTARISYNPPLFIKINNVLGTGIGLLGTMVFYVIAVYSHVGRSDYLAFLQSYGMVSGAFMGISSLAASVARIAPILEMAKPILDTVPETRGDREVITSLRGNIELQNIRFRYTEDGPWVIDNLSLRVHSGEYLAIVGQTGCGKSTLVRLLLGFEKAQEGNLFFDGKNIEQLDLKSLRGRIGTVLQTGSLFNDSIYANISISAPGLSHEKAWKAAEIAGIADDIREMPMGMHTTISEGQGGISGGQKQRLMIARAIAPEPSVLIFDEATSALDNITQKKVTDALSDLHCTRIVIAHRLSTIQACDRILFLQDGRIMEEGTYEELMERKGLFAQMVERQQTGPIM